MKIFKDQKLTQPTETLDLGRLAVGLKKAYEFYLYNESEFTVEDIQITAAHAEVNVLSAPQVLKSHASSAFTVEWTASLKLRSGLKTTVTVTGTEIWAAA